MAINVRDLKLYGSATMPDDDAITNIGGAESTSVKLEFVDLAGLFQLVSSSGVDTTGQVQVHYKDTVDVLTNVTLTAGGLTPVAGGVNIGQLMKALKLAAPWKGDIAIEGATAEFSGTAVSGSADGRIVLPAGASSTGLAAGQPAISHMRARCISSHVGRLS